MLRNTILRVALIWAASSLSANAMVQELSTGDRVTVHWICIDKQSIEQIRDVAMRADRAAFKAAVGKYANADENARCMIFDKPTMVKLVERQFTFTDSDPAYYVEAWSAKFGVFSGYTFFGQSIGTELRVGSRQNAGGQSPR